MLLEPPIDILQRYGGSVASRPWPPPIRLAKDALSERGRLCKIDHRASPHSTYRSDRKQSLAVTVSAGRLVLRHANKSAAPGRGDRTITPCCKMAGTSGGGATRIL